MFCKSVADDIASKLNLDKVFDVSILSSSKTKYQQSKTAARVLQDNINIRQALKAMGLSAKGGNYQRARDIIFKYNIEHLMQEHQEGKPLE